jgi:DnaJ-related protein SCJ1
VQALLGFERNLTHLDGHIVTLKRKGVTQPGIWIIMLNWPRRPDMVLGYVQTIKGEGMPVFEHSTHGDLFVEYNVVLPTALSKDAKQSES